tara:strand:- start:876 stop:1550 length:675 start_codon:yes stop_codon:yes gene_type:complete
MKIIFLGKREWALKVYEGIRNHSKISKIVLAKSHEQTLSYNIKDYDLLITCGWSEEIGEEIADNIMSIGVHCAELDRYSYGTPIQLQIIDGITITKHRIFHFTNDPKSPRAHTHNRLFSHEIDLDLSGNMTEILGQMISTSIILFNQYLDDYPNIEWKEWEEEEIVRKKRTPRDSKIDKNELITMSAKQIYNLFRCLEAPYPNAYIEDNTGKLFFKKVGFEKKK